MDRTTSAGATTDTTPLMKQYWELKNQVPDALLFFRMGDFYELFGDDAVAAAGILEITLTSRDKNKANPTPMAGVPHHSVQGYIQKLLKAGKKVAIGEQMEDPSEKGASKIVRREITRLLTPAVHFDAEGSDANYLATVVKSDAKTWVLACLDASTGEALVSQPLPLDPLCSEMRRLTVKHYLQIHSEVGQDSLALQDPPLCEPIPKNYLSLERARELLERHYGMQNLSAFISSEAGILALGILVTYVLRSQQQEKLAHLRLPEPLQKPKTLALGPNTAQHLDLPELFELINRTRCTLGARQLKRWLMAPLRTSGEIAHRQHSVIELSSRRFESVSLGEKISQALTHVYDLERICGRINTRLANPRDTLALGQSLVCLVDLERLLSNCHSPLLTEFKQNIHKMWAELAPLAAEITNRQREDAPLSSKDGGIFKTGYSPDLDRYISLNENGQKWLVDLETRERESTQIPSLKVRYNRVFGYYIEITQAHLKNVPSHYQRKQTMVGAERFFTDELKTFEEEILSAGAKQKSLEQELFAELVGKVQALTPAIMETARVFGEMDALASLAALAQNSGWCFPQLNDSLTIEIQGGRHPVVDQNKRGSFVPNDLQLSPNSRLTLLITGPNMGGKSTVMRQTALIIILGQMGAPVPAKQATWGVVSSLFTRIGAQDAISRGQSTFMVEMSELAQILHQADNRSLIILDEIGRGTSTYDGISVAWATLEWICTRIQARTLFATHYHELIHLAATLPLLANAHMAVERTAKTQQHRETLRFLYELKEGPTNESFGIHVAKLAGLPKPVIDRAWKILAQLEEQTSAASHSRREQLSLFDSMIQPSGMDSFETEETEELPPAAPPEPVVHPVVEELESLNIDAMTPVQALNFVVQLQGKYARRS